MKKINFTIVLALIAAVSLTGQTNLFPASGDVGIGTTSPGYALSVEATGGNAVHLKGNTTGALVYSAALFIAESNIDYRGRGLFLPSTAAESSKSWFVGVPYTGSGFQIGNSSTHTPQASDGPYVKGNAQLFISSTGNVGLGTTSPGEKLQVEGVILAGDQASGAANGSLGFGIRYYQSNIINTFGSQYSSAATTLGYAVKPKQGAAGFVSSVENYAAPRGALSLSAELIFSNTSADTISIGDDVTLTERFRINASGNVGIGTATPSHKLAVNGTIRAKEIIVDTGWADYVFEDDYGLKPLDEVEAFIDTHGHLPDVPSSETVAATGLSVGESQALMMQKIEELTLYVIDLQKQNNAQAMRIEQLESQGRGFR